MNLFAYLRAWLRRKPGLAPMPPMPVPGLPVDKPVSPLTVHERVRFGLLAMSWKDPDIVAVDPMEKP